MLSRWGYLGGCVVKQENRIRNGDIGDDQLVALVVEKEWWYSNNRGRPKNLWEINMYNKIALKPWGMAK